MKTLLQLYTEAAYNTDHEYAYEARRFADKLTKLLLEFNIDDDRFSIRDNGVLIFGSDIDKKYSDLVIGIIERNSRHFTDSSGGFTVVKTKNERDPLIVLPILRIVNDNFEIGTIPTDLIVHEFIHYLDWKRYKNTGYTVAKNKAYHTKTGYYNNPAEFNAYFQQTAEYIMRTYIDDPSYLWLLDDKLATFNTFKKWIIEVFDSAFIKNLNPEYQKKFDKRLYQVYISAVEKLKDL